MVFFLGKAGLRMEYTAEENKFSLFGIADIRNDKKTVFFLCGL